MHDATLPRTWRGDASTIGLVSLAHGTSHFFHLLLPPLFPWIMRDLGLRFTDVAFLTTVFFAVSGTGQALAGFAVDRVGALRMLLGAIVLLASSGFALGCAHSYAELLVVAAMAGAGNSIFHPADFTILNRRVAASRLGHAFAMHGLVGNLGWAAGASFMAAVAAAAGWHAAGFAAAAVAALVAAFLWTQRRHLTVDPAPVSATPGAAMRGATPAGSGSGGRFDFLRSPTVWTCFAFFYFATGAGGILQNFAPTILMHLYPVSIAVGSAALTAYLLGSAAGMLPGGFLASHGARSDRIIAVALLLAAAVPALIAMHALAVAALLPAMAVLGFGIGVAGPSRDLLVRHAATSRFGADSFGRVYGFVYSGLDIGVATIPLAIGRLLDGGHFSWAMGAVAVLLVIATGAAVRVR